MTKQLFYLACAASLVLSSSQATGHQNADVQPMDGVELMLDAFDDYPIVALSEMHSMQEEHDFIQVLLRDPAFPEKVDAVVMEGGNALYQDVLDGYILTGEVPLSDVRVVWRNSSQSPNLIWDVEVFEQIYTTIREINEDRPPAQRVRVLAGGVPIDWNDITTAEDMGRYRMHRSEYYASVVEREVLEKEQTALLIIGGMHILHHSNREEYRRMVTERLEDRYPNSVFVVWPHTGMLGADMDQEYLSEEELARRGQRGSAAMTTQVLEERLASWPVPSIARVENTWLGDLELSLLLPGGFSFEGEYIPSSRDHGGLTLSEGIDAYLYLGPKSSLTLAGVNPAVLDDEAYLAELDRRSRLRFGRPFDRGSIDTERRKYFPGGGESPDRE